MACVAVQTWSLRGLVAAFLDLAVAFLLLCASAVVYLASKFLGFFGLTLPCPCDGMFSKGLCLSRLLIDFPTQQVSDVQLSVKQRLPFNCSEYSYNCVDEIVRVEGEASCSSVVTSERGKGVLNRTPRSRLRRRRWSDDHGKNSLFLSCDPPLDEEVIDCSEFSTNRGSGFSGDAHNLEYDNKALRERSGRPRNVTSVEMNESHDEDVNIKKSMQSIKELGDNQQEFQSSDGDDTNRIRLLEQELEEEHIARAALYIELEKERIAAATAADEAMAMILRLQEEKASVEIEARQYQRILEEKSVYDAEEMSILKEILVRREMEKHFLEKEVEAYRQIISVGNAELAGDGVGASVDPNIEQFIFDKNTELTENSLKKPVCNLSEDVGLQEKEIIISNWNNQLTSNALQAQELNQAYNIDEKIIETCNGNEKRDTNHDQSLKEQESKAFLESSTSGDPTLDKERLVYDLHIIGDDSCLSSDHLEIKDDVKRSSMEISRELPPVGKTRRSRTRSTTTAMDGEMLKIDGEIGWLRERLKLVQEGREKLGLNRERENIQWTLLEEIARQVQEIRRLTDPGKAARQVSLPPPTSKVLSKKRRSRSVSSGLQMSSD